jgi:AcrR family transcriptional regulator
LPVAEPVGAESLRDRRRTQTVDEIKQAALLQLTATGTGALSLRAVAREVGMTVQSLYHYFDSRDALLTALVTDAHDALAAAVTAAVDSSAGQPREQRRTAASAAYRDWALQHRAQFLLIYGTPVPGFQARPGDGTGDAASKLATPFAEVVFDGWTAHDLASLNRAPLNHDPGTAVPAPADALVQVGAKALPLGAALYFLELRARLHGLVMLELLGHLYLPTAHSDQLFSLAMARVSAEIDALQPQR